MLQNKSKYAVVKKHHERSVHVSPQSNIGSRKNGSLIFFTSSFYFHLFSKQALSTFSVSLNWISLINWSHFISHILNLKNNGEIWFPQHVEFLQGFSIFAVFCLPHGPTRPLSARISVFSSAASLEKTISNVVTSSLLQQLRFQHW